jgi:hypothetical protein
MTSEKKYRISLNLLERLKENSYRCRELVPPVYCEVMGKNVYHLRSRNEQGLIVTKKDPEFQLLARILELENI